MGNTRRFDTFGHDVETERVNPEGSFNQLVGLREQQRRHCEAERPGGLAVDHRPVVYRLLHGQIGCTTKLVHRCNQCGANIEDHNHKRRQAPALELLFRRDPPLHLLAAAAIAGGQPLRC